MPFSTTTTIPATLKLTETTVLSTLSTYTNNPTLALEFYNYISSPPHSFSHSPSTFSLLISVLGKHFLFSHSQSLLLSSPLVSPSSLRAHFNRLCAARLPSDSILFFSTHAPKLNLHNSLTYSHLIDSLCEHRHVEEAETLALITKPFEPTTKIHNMILRGWMKAGAWRKCKEFWARMDDMGIRKDLVSYSIYMDVMIKCGKPWKAVKIFKEIRKRNEFAMDVVVYNTLMHAAGSVDGPDEAVRVLREMGDEGCTPNLVSYNTVIKMLCKEGRVREGYSFLYKMRKAGVEPNVITYHCFFQYSMSPNEILWLFDKMFESGCMPRMDTYVMLMKKFRRWGFLRPVFMVWEKMEKHGVSPDAFAYNAMIDALLDKRMVELAKKYDDEMVEKGLAAKPRKEFGTKYLGIVSSDNNDDENAFSGVL